MHMVNPFSWGAVVARGLCRVVYIAVATSAARRRTRRFAVRCQNLSLHVHTTSARSRPVLPFATASNQFTFFAEHENSANHRRRSCRSKRDRLKQNPPSQTRKNKLLAIAFGRLRQNQVFLRFARLPVVIIFCRSLHLLSFHTLCPGCCATPPPTNGSAANRRS